MKMTSKSLSEKISKSISCTIAVIAIAVVVSQGYSIWTNVIANSQSEAGTGPLSYFSWSSKADSPKQKTAFPDKPPRLETMHASLEAPLLLDAYNTPVEAMAEDLDESSTEHLDAPKNQSVLSEITESDSSLQEGVRVAASSRNVAEAESNAIRNSESVITPDRFDGNAAMHSIPWDTTFQSTPNSPVEVTLPAPSKPIRVGERSHPSKPQVSSR